MKRSGKQGNLGNAITDLIRRAAVDDAFRDRLVSERSGAAADAGVTLHPQEQHLLDTYPEHLLTGLIKNMPGEGQERREFLKKASVITAATISAGLARQAGAADSKDDKAAADDNGLLKQLKAAERQIEGIRKQLQKEAARAMAVHARRKAEREVVEEDMPMVIAGIAPPPKYRPRRKTSQEHDRDKKELNRIQALEKVLNEVKAELESALIEVELKKKALAEE
jgi:hypothetical protein